MKEFKYKITKSGINNSVSVYGTDNVYYCLLDFIFKLDAVKEIIPERILNICEQAQEWCEQAELGGKYQDEDFTIEVTK